MPVDPNFAKKLAANKQAAKRFNAAKKAEVGTDFSNPDIPSGEYIVRVRAKAGVSPNQDTPFVDFRTTIIVGEYAGAAWSNTSWLQNDDAEKEQQAYDRVSRAVQVLFDVSQDDLDDWTMDDLVAALEQIDQDKPICRVRVKKVVGDDKRIFLNTYFNSLVAEADLPDDEPVADDDDDDDADDDGDEPEPESAKPKRGSRKPAKAADPEPDDDDADDDADDDGDEEDETVLFAKGKFVWYKPPRRRSALCFKITKSLKTKRTADLVEHEGDLECKAVSWDDLEPAEDNEGDD